MRRRKKKLKENSVKKFENQLRSYREALTFSSPKVRHEVWHSVEIPIANILFTSIFPTIDSSLP
jgi:hypothetical protein